MLQINDTLISFDVLEKHFCCDLEQCKGVCCVKGDAGAPLTAEEVELLPRIIEKVKPFMRPEGVRAVEEQATHVIDDEGETVTPLVNGEECAYVIFENGIAFCAIEKAFLEGKIKFQKPVSCHLYPVRIRKYEQFTAVNYDTWDICKPARLKGEELKLPVFEFVRDALIRKFGKDWYKHLSIAKKELK
ncbi:MAG: DUF3109 family protein [Bacteroidales bacterium]|nr:DUF3109 family protein [Bacteroidales bacterium]